MFYNDGCAQDEEEKKRKKNHSTQMRKHARKNVCIEKEKDAHRRPRVNHSTNHKGDPASLDGDKGRNARAENETARGGVIYATGEITARRSV